MRAFTFYIYDVGAVEVQRRTVQAAQADVPRWVGVRRICLRRAVIGGTIAQEIDVIRSGIGDGVGHVAQEDTRCVLAVHPGKMNVLVDAVGAPVGSDAVHEERHDDLAHIWTRGRQRGDHQVVHLKLWVVVSFSSHGEQLCLRADKVSIGGPNKHHIVMACVKERRGVAIDVVAAKNLCRQGCDIMGFHGHLPYGRERCTGSFSQAPTAYFRPPRPTNRGRNGPNLSKIRSHRSNCGAGIPPK